MPAPHCVVVGGGPAGAVLALSLAREGVRVTVLERTTDFDRPFRGNTLNPGALVVLDCLGLAERVLALPHTRVTHFTAVDAAGAVRFADFTALPGPFPFVALMQQADLLPLLFAEARHAGARLVTGATVTGLCERGGRVAGVVADTPHGREVVDADLVVACDGRGSVVRRLAGLVPRDVGAPIDVAWCTLPAHPGDDPAQGAYFRFGPGLMAALMPAGAHWQVGLIVRKGALPTLRARGLEAFRAALAAAVPAVADRTEALTSWDAVAPLEVRVDRLPRWHRPGLLCLGDAAHAMSPVGMVGITLAVQDAAAAAEVLAGPLRRGTLAEADLAAVQRRREGAVRLVQAAQALAHRFVLGPALRGAPRLPEPLRTVMGARPAARLAAHLIAHGRLALRRDRVRRDAPRKRARAP